jgi:hypothetical protein
MHRYTKADLLHTYLHMLLLSGLSLPEKML